LRLGVIFWLGKQDSVFLFHRLRRNIQTVIRGNIQAVRRRNIQAVR